MNQLKNAVRLSVDRKDKICVLEDSVIVLIVDEDKKRVNNLIARIKINLPGESEEHLSRIIKYISVFTIPIEKNINSADDFLIKFFQINRGTKLFSSEQPRVAHDINETFLNPYSL